MSPSILSSYPEYALTAHLDSLRATEFSYLDASSHVYLDYTGAGLAPHSALAAHAARLGFEGGTVFGNPHSVNPSSAASTELVERCRARVLAHFGADPREYAVIFTPNASGAARLVGESYPFEQGRGAWNGGRRTKGGKRLILTTDNHNSINGIREFAAREGVKVEYVGARRGKDNPDLRIDTEDVLGVLKGPVDESLHKIRSGGFTHLLLRSCAGAGPYASLLSTSSLYDSDERAPRPVPAPGSCGLFAYPAQSNFHGIRHPLSWVSAAQLRGFHVLLDAAAYLPTSRLDLSPGSSCHPDFVTASWYKVLGYPTGVGCLLARRDALRVLRRPWFAGGTVMAVTVAEPWHRLVPQPADGAAEGGEPAFEDGTLNFLSIPDVATGLDWLATLAPPGCAGIDAAMEAVGTRTRCLTGWFLDRLCMPRHSNGSPLVVLYGPKNTRDRGSTVSFNILDATGARVDERLVAAESAAAGISLRTGCFCNPGASEDAFDLDVKETLRGCREMSQMDKGTTADGDGWRASKIAMWRKQGQTPTDQNCNAISEKGVGKLEGEGELDPILRLTGMPTAGAIRVSFGVASNTRDVDTFLEWMERTYKDRIMSVEGLTPRETC